MDEFLHIRDRRLRDLYRAMHGRPYEVLREGEEHLSKASDPLAVLEAMREATQVILEDLAEHGRANAILYGNHGAAYFRKVLKSLDGRIARRRKKGDRSDVFSIYKKRYEERMDRAADDFLAEMDRDENLQRSSLKELNEALGTPTRFAELLREAARVTGADPAFIQGICGLVHNALVGLGRAGKAWAAGPIVGAFSEVKDKVRAAPLFEEAVSSALAVALLAGSEELQEVVAARLLPDDISNPRLAFNVACWHAARGRKPDLLRAVKRALRLGKAKEEFLSDADFAPFLEDQDFRNVLGF